MERTTIQNYINNFRNSISRFLKENVGIKTIVYQYSNGAVLVFVPGVNTPNNDEYKKEVSTINDALMKTNLFEKEILNLSISFSGTYRLPVPNKLIILKDDSEVEWTASRAEIDVMDFIHSLND